MDCARAEELLSDHVDGSLHEILRAELDAHLASCPACPALRSALLEVVESLRAFPDLEPASGLVDRIVAATRGSRPVMVLPRVIIRPAIPSWVQAAAAGFALITLGILLMVVGPEAPTRAATRLVQRTVEAGSSVQKRKDRLVEDVRILGVVLSTAFEGRLERVNERLDDYRRLLERRREDADTESKRGSQSLPRAIRFADGFRTGDGAGS